MSNQYQNKRYQDKNKTSKEGKEKKKKALEDYVEVNVRIEKFWQQYPQGRIFTEILKWEGETIAMKAQIFKNIDDLFPSAIGHAYEKESSSFINATSALENCETSCIGRALAIMGFEIKKSIASKQEVENAKLQQQMLNNEKGDTSGDTRSDTKQSIQEIEEIKYFKAIKEKWEIHAESMDGFDEWFIKRKNKGLTNKHIYEALVQYIEKNQQQAN